MDVANYIKAMQLNLSNLENTLLSLPEPNSVLELNKWNVTQIVEHIYLVEYAVVLQIIKGIDSALHPEQVIVGYDKMHRILIGLRAKKVASPEIFMPKGKFENAQKAVVVLQEFRNSWLQKLQNQKLLITNNVFEHPYLGKMTVIDWLYFLQIHAERHQLQIQDLA